MEGVTPAVDNRWRLVRPRGLLGVLPLLVFLALRQALGAEVAIMGGFGTSVVVFALNRGHAGPVLGLSTFALSIAAVASVAALWMRNERIYFGGDPAWDFGMAAVLLGSILVRRPLTGVLAHELVPALRDALTVRHAIFYITTLLVSAMYLSHGFVRLTLLLRTESIEQYLVLSRAVQWPTVLLVLVLIAWLIRRAAERSGGAAG